MTIDIEGYHFLELGITYPDSIHFPDLCGNEIICYKDDSYTIIPGGFKNPLGLQFVDPDGIEYLVLREIELGYQFDDLGLTQDSIVIDIGAHVGIVSMTLAGKYGCTVDAYEPAPDNYRRLVCNIRKNGLMGFVIPHHSAVTGDGRPVTVGGPQGDNSGGMSIYPTIYPTCQFVPVPSVTLRDVIGGRTIDLLKIDCEGAEHEIFQDLTPLARVKAIRGEFHNMRGTSIEFTGASLLERVRSAVPNTRVT
jgi:FkbM family methyltransferase